jgi:predicted RNA-binding protein Jag
MGRATPADTLPAQRFRVSGWHYRERKPLLLKPEQKAAAKAARTPKVLRTKQLKEDRQKIIHERLKTGKPVPLLPKTRR